MEKRLSYTIVGAFVIIITLALFFFLYWITKYGAKSIEHDYYKTYFTESVSGLSLDSPVKLRGVEVGRVKSISINKANSEEVEILLEINQGTPIKKDTYAILDTQGITGLKHVELEGGTHDSALLKQSKSEVPTIMSKKSILATLYDSSESMAQKLNRISEKVNQVLSQKNIDNVSKIITDLSNTTQYLDENKQRLTKMFDQISELKTSIEVDLHSIRNDFLAFHENSKDFMNHAKDFEDKIVPSFDKLGRASDRLGAASDVAKIFFIEVQKDLVDGKFNLADIVERNMQVLNETAFSIQNLSLRLDSAIEEFQQSPSDVLYKVGKKIPGPGENHE